MFYESVHQNKQMFAEECPIDIPTFKVLTSLGYRARSINFHVKIVLATSYRYVR